MYLRLGDYLVSQNHYVVKIGKSYYKNAFKILKRYVPQVRLLIFSNDITYCKAHFVLESGAEPYFIAMQGLEFKFVEGNDEGEHRILSLCDYANTA